MKKLVFVGLILSFIVGFMLSPYASSLPDGLEKVAIKYKVENKEKVLFDAPFKDYQVKILDNDRLATSFAGLIGTGIVFLSVVGLFKLISRKK